MNVVAGTEKTVLLHGNIVAQRYTGTRMKSASYIKIWSVQLLELERLFYYMVTLLH